jgi:hypothetical protein
VSICCRWQLRVRICQAASFLVIPPDLLLFSDRRVSPKFNAYNKAVLLISCFTGEAEGVRSERFRDEMGGTTFLRKSRWPKPNTRNLKPET